MITVTASSQGNYQGCALHVVDHGNNLSNALILESICDYDGAGLTITQAECRALEDFYIATEGWNWNSGMDDNRFQTLDVNQWNGITVAGGHVTEFAAGDAPQNIAGTVPGSFANLDRLVSFDMDHQLLTGALTLFANMQDLEVFECYNCTGISGNISSFATNNQDLVRLDIRGTAMSGDLSDLATITTLELLRV